MVSVFIDTELLYMKTGCEAWKKEKYGNSKNRKRKPID